MRSATTSSPTLVTFELKVALIEATQMWGALTGKGTPCPVVFDAEDVDEHIPDAQVQAWKKVCLVHTHR